MTDIASLPSGLVTIETGPNPYGGSERPKVYKRGRPRINKDSEDYKLRQEAGKQFLRYYTYLSYQKKLRDREKIENPDIDLPDITFDYSRQYFMDEYLKGNDLYDREYLQDKFFLNKVKMSKDGKIYIKDKDAFFEELDKLTETELLKKKEILKNQLNTHDPLMETKVYKEINYKIFHVDATLSRRFNYYKQIN